jgi:hypothetical protein
MFFKGSEYPGHGGDMAVAPAAHALLQVARRQEILPTVTAELAACGSVASVTP